MPLKCCVTNCDSNYFKRGKPVQPVSVYRLPSENDPERAKWLKNIPRDNVPLTKNTVVCKKHWKPEEVDNLGYNRRPSCPPTIFDCVPMSQRPTPAPKPRPTKRAHSPTRNHLPDELEEFIKKDTIRFEDINGKFMQNVPEKYKNVNIYVFEEKIHIVSPHLLSNTVAKFIIKIHPDLKYEAYQAGTRVFPFASRLHVHKMETWTGLVAVLDYLEMSQPSHKNNVLLQHIDCMNKEKIVGQRVYDIEVILRAFEYYAVSRSCYHRLYKDYKLPCTDTLRKLTCKTKSINDLEFVKSVFNNLDEKQCQCLILVDEIHVKPLLVYSGGSIFGEAANRPGEFANRVLGIMVVCLFGGPAFLAKVIPVKRITAGFQKEEVMLVNDAIKEGGGKVLGILLDNNRVNQSFIKAFPTDADKPWAMTDKETGEKTFILNDYVHVYKCVRNNWYTEITKEIEYYCFEDSVYKIAKWEHLKKLYDLDKGLNVNIGHPLDVVAISPKPIERQSVNTMLKIFNDKTVSALLNHPGLAHESTEVKATANFIQLFTDVWTVCNVRSPHSSDRLRDVRRQVSRLNCSVTDDNLDKLLALANMVEKMNAANGKCRKKCFTKDTSKALIHTLRGLVDLTRHLLSHGDGFEYVMLGQFSSDKIEKEFGKLRQGAGGTYFITVRDVLQKTAIKHTQLALELEIIDLNTKDVGHVCDKCNRLLSPEECDVFDCLTDSSNLDELEEVLDESSKMGLVHIAGYVERKEDEDKEHETFNYYEKYGNFTSHINRGGLHKPDDSTSQWVFMCYYLFSVVPKTEVCRTSLARYFFDLSECYSLDKD